MSQICHDLQMICRMNQTNPPKINTHGANVLQIRKAEGGIEYVENHQLPEDHYQECFNQADARNWSSDTIEYFNKTNLIDTFETVEPGRLSFYLSSRIQAVFQELTTYFRQAFMHYVKAKIAIYNMSVASTCWPRPEYSTFAENVDLVSNNEDPKIIETRQKLCLLFEKAYANVFALKLVWSNEVRQSSSIVMRLEPSARAVLLNKIATFQKELIDHQIKDGLSHYKERMRNHSPFEEIRAQVRGELVLAMMTSAHTQLVNIFV